MANIKNRKELQLIHGFTHSTSLSIGNYSFFCKRSSCPEEKSPMVSFPDPQTILKQWEERHGIVSCDQLGETLRAAPIQLL